MQTNARVPLTYLEELENKGRELVRLHHVLSPLFLLLSVASFASLVFSKTDLQSVFLPELFGVFFGAAAFFSWRMIGKTKSQIRSFGLLKKYLSSEKRLSISSTRLKFSWAFHPIVDASVDASGRRIPVTVDLKPGHSGEYFAEPAHLEINTPWKRPDLLLISRDFFFTDFAVFHSFQEFSFREDIWQVQYEGIYVDWVFEKLKLRLMLNQEELKALGQFNRLNRALDAFILCVKRSQEPPGRFAPLLLDHDPEMKISLVILFGMTRVERCEKCYATPWRKVTVRGKCSKCSGPIVKVAQRSGLGMEAPEKRALALRQFAGENR